MNQRSTDESKRALSCTMSESDVTQPMFALRVDSSILTQRSIPRPSLEVLSVLAKHRLRVLNLGVSAVFGVVSLLLFVDALTSGDRGLIPVVGAWWTREPELAADVHRGFVFRPATLNDGVKVGFLCCALTMLACVDHLVVSTVGRTAYEAGLERGYNLFRWTEYAVSASIMNVMIGMLSGVLDVLLLTCIAALTATCMFFGALGERVHRDSPEYTALFWAGCVPFLAAWAVIFSSFGVAGSRSTIPDFVYALVSTLFVLELCFGINQLRRIDRFLSREIGYIILSPTAKLVLAGITYGGIRALPSKGVE